jgi:hypothetical protein
MSSSYVTNIALLILGAFLVVVSQAFSVGTFTWLMFGGGIAAIVMSAPVTPLRGRGTPQRALDGVIAVLGSWTVVASMVFAGAAVTWLGFASGLGLFALATIGLTVHELRTERVVHSLAPTHASSADYDQLAGANY